MKIMEEATPAAAAGGYDNMLKRKPPAGWRRKCCRCTGVAIFILLVLIIIIVILIFTIFKAKDPRIAINSVNLENFDASLTFPALQPSITLLLRLNITVHNPNRAGFKYGNGTSFLFYHGEEVGEALIPAGKISAGGNETMVTVVSIKAGTFLTNSNLLSDVSQGILPISSQTRLSGRIKLLRIINKHAVAKTFCDVIVSISSRNVQKFHCSYKVKL